MDPLSARTSSSSRPPPFGAWPTRSSPESPSTCATPLGAAPSTARSAGTAAGCRTARGCRRATAPRRCGRPGGPRCRPMRDQEKQAEGPRWGQATHVGVFGVVHPALDLNHVGDGALGGSAHTPLPPVRVEKEGARHLGPGSVRHHQQLSLAENPGEIADVLHVRVHVRAPHRAQHRQSAHVRLHHGVGVDHVKRLGPPRVRRQHLPAVVGGVDPRLPRPRPAHPTHHRVERPNHHREHRPQPHRRHPLSGDRGV
jgi:hypothetical protein